MSKSNKSRSVNFTNEEEFVLSREVMARSLVITGEFSATLTAAHKQRAWECVTEMVNAVSPVTRSIEKIKAKWADLRKRTKAKLSANKREVFKTGGGIPTIIPLTDTEQMVSTQIGQASVNGVGCTDTFGDEWGSDIASTSSCLQHCEDSSLPPPPPPPAGQQSQLNSISSIHPTVSQPPPSASLLFEGLLPVISPAPVYPRANAKNSKFLLQKEIGSATQEKNNLTRELIEMKRAEYAAKERRHQETIKLQEKQVQVLEAILARMGDQHSLT